MRYFYSDRISSAELILAESERKHLVKTLRKRVGDSVNVLDGKGSVYQCEVKEIHKDYVLGLILGESKHSRPLWSLHLAIAPTKNLSKMEWMTEKCTELGVDKITFLHCQRSERAKVNIGRLKRIAVSAMKQSGRFFLPQIENSVPYPSFVNNSLPVFRYIAHCADGEKAPLQDVAKDENVVILIGPEGDFTKEELVLAKKANFKELSLGNTRLRTETAGIHVTSVINFINQNKYASIPD